MDFKNPRFSNICLVNIKNWDFKNPRLSTSAFSIFTYSEYRKLGFKKSETFKHLSFRYSPIVNGFIKVGKKIRVFNLATFEDHFYLSRGCTCNFLFELATRHPQSCSAEEVEGCCTCNQVSSISATSCRKFNSMNILQRARNSFCHRNNQDCYNCYRQWNSF